MQRAELEEMRQREANMTALLAIGPRKKFKPDSQGGGTNGQQVGSNSRELGQRSTRKILSRWPNYLFFFFLLVTFT